MPKFLVTESFKSATIGKDLRGIRPNLFTSLKGVSQEPYFNVLAVQEPVKGKVVSVHCHVQAPDLEEAYTWYSRLVSQAFTSLGVKVSSTACSIVPEIL
jgi:hypothetical protein